VTIYVDTLFLNQALIWKDLLEIARCDSGLSLSLELPQSVQQVYYSQRQVPVASANRLLALVQHPKTVLIVGVGKDFVVGGNAMSGHLGGFAQGATATDPATVWIDVTEHDGAGYTVLDTSGATIYLPRPVLLYHELAHAYHFMQGATAGSPAASQAQAIKDENEFRNQLGIPLRHPTNDQGGVGAPSRGGTTFPSCSKKKEEGFSCNNCNIASAALESPDAPEVEQLRRIGQDYLNLSLWTTLISEPLLDVYRRFSPGVARAMNADPALRQAMLLYAVLPVLHLFRIAERCLRPDAGDDELIAAIDRSVDDYLADLGEAEASARLHDAAEGAAGAARALAGKPTTVARAPAGEMPTALFRYLSSAIASAGGEASGYAWAFEGLALFLRQAAARSADRAASATALLDEIGGWLARLPIPADALLDIADAGDELGILAERLFTSADRRAQFAEQLLARWPTDSAAALRVLLDEQDYLHPPPVAAE
jgi:hypothetical protein